jgi:hypothetical protein
VVELRGLELHAKHVVRSEPVSDRTNQGIDVDFAPIEAALTLAGNPVGLMHHTLL